MPLEVVNFINDLAEANPVAGLDQKFEGDDHIRNIKKGIKATFPGMAGRAWRTIPRSASFSLASTDNMTLNNCAAGITVQAASAASLGNGFHAFLRAPTTGSVVFNPADDVNGLDSFTIPAGHIGMIFGNGTEFFAVIMYSETPAVPQIFPTGTRLVFQQTTAPTGWTKVVSSSHNNAALRFTTGSAGVGGSVDFSTIFAASGARSTNSHTLTSAQIPPVSVTYTGPAALDGTSGGPAQTPMFDQAETSASGVAWGTTAGGGQGHSHTLPTFDVKYVDCIVAEKN